MGTKLLIISDMWGAKGGHWITSYLGYLQQYYDISFYDSQQLANLDLTVGSEDNIMDAFFNGGIDRAVTHLMAKEQEPAHILGFGVGATIAWKAGLSGMPMESLYAISPTRIQLEEQKPQCGHNILFGEYDLSKPTYEWADRMCAELEIFPNFGRKLYTDEKIIQKISQDLLAKIIKKAG